MCPHGAHGRTHGAHACMGPMQSRPWRPMGLGSPSMGTWSPYASAIYQIDALDAPLHLHDVHDALRSGGDNHGVTQFNKSVFCMI